MKWHKYPEEKPTKNGQYLCCNISPYTNNPWFHVYSWSDNLHNVDDFDFATNWDAGWYGYDAEWGYYETNCNYWQEIEWEINK